MSDHASTYLTPEEAARRLPVSRRTLTRWGEADPFYAPDVAQIAGQPWSCGALRGRRYHAEHVELIRAVMCDGLDLETARLKWQARQTMMRLAVERIIGWTDRSNTTSRRRAVVSSPGS